jgi:hypothetical protein
MVRSTAERRPTDLKSQVKRLILRNPPITIDEIMNHLNNGGDVVPSRFTVASISSEFKHSLRVMYQEGIIGKQYVRRKKRDTTRIKRVRL